MSIAYSEDIELFPTICIIQILPRFHANESSPMNLRAFVVATFFQFFNQFVLGRVRQNCLH